MAKSSSWDKFVLLLWKNWLLQRKHKCQVLVELFIPVLFTTLIVLLRILVTTDHIDVTKYDELSINTLELFKTMVQESNAFPEFMLLYSPKDELLDNIVKDAAASLGLRYNACSNAMELETQTVAVNALAAVQFDESMAGKDEYPDSFEYTLRFPSELRTVSGLIPRSWSTLRLYPEFQTFGPRNKMDADGGSPPGYLREGFLPIQNALSMSFLRLKSGQRLLPDVMLQRYPYPAYYFDPLHASLTNLLVFMITISFTYACTCITKSITTEKEKQLKEVMIIMGLANWLHWAAWMVKSFILLFVSALLIIIMLKIPFENGAVLKNSNFFALLLFMAFYVFNVICLCFMLATFFAKASTASAVSGLLFFLTYVPMLFILRSYATIGQATKIAWCLLTNTAMGMGILQIVEFEGAGKGLQFNNLFSSVNVDDNLSVGLVMVMMLVSSIIYMIICLYVEQIYPGDYGVPRPWYFPFSRSFWCSKRNNYLGVENLSDTDVHRPDPKSFEQEPDDAHIGLQIKNLKKKFGSRMAVKGLSINMFEDEITVLLGHNGAGKTTTIAMLTGMFPPTSGTAIINGSDIRTNISGARMSLGICPQHNVLFDEMSVADHIRFFTRIKGLSNAEVEVEVVKYLKLIELEDKANAPSSTLSGGMKRKLSACCALSGNTKVVLFDEPSSGMDPAARRQLWDMLLKEKSGRTILLTTHFMDEADVLGDRIAIMCDGELRCYGTTFFLKKYYGCGYKLICVKEDDCDVSKVTELLSGFIPGIEPESDIGTELTYQLPDNYSDRFEIMLSKLDQKLSELHLSGFGVGITSLEDVFMKVGAESNADPGRNSGGYQSANSSYTNLQQQQQHSDYDEQSIQSNNAFSNRNKKLRGLQLSVNQWTAMLLKKIHLTWGNKILMLVQIILPLIFVITTILFSRAESAFRGLPAMKIDLNQYPKAVTVLDHSQVAKGSWKHNISVEYEKLAKSYGANYEFEDTGDTNFSTYILNIGETMQSRVNDRYQAAASISDDVMIAWLNNQPLHTAPLTVNLLHNAMARSLFGENSRIVVTNYPLPYTTRTVLNQLNFANGIGAQLAMNLSFSLCFVTTMYIFMLIKERVSRAKLLQFVSGVRVWTFWLSQFVWDIFTLGITVFITVLVIACFQEEGFSNVDELGRFLLLLVVFGCAALPMTYLLSLLFAEPAFAFIIVAMTNIFVGVAIFLVCNVMSIEALGVADTARLIASICRIFPHFSLSMGLNNLYINGATRRACEKIGTLPPVLMCELMPKCCQTALKGYFDWATPGILKEIVYLIVMALIFFAIVIINEFGILKEIRYFISKKLNKPAEPVSDGYFEDDVEKERKRILAMTADEIETKNLVLDRVTKYYGKFRAVNEVSICVKEMECFGLLGVNGAGKTSTFKMLTGDEIISSGNAYVQGLSMKNKMNDIYTRIGYCPQFDALLDVLTGRQTLRIFCLLRGIPSSQIRFVSEDLAKSFEFSKHLDKQTRHYSGGNKRKLSAALALMGSPPVAYMDEPTTGMDPAARRSLWNMVCRVRDLGKSIVLTSHSMEECEALCTRLAIMVNGELKCIGSTQHLKNKYSKGIVLKIKLRQQRNLSVKVRRESSAEDLPSTPVPYENSSEITLRRSVDTVQNGTGNKVHDSSIRRQESNYNPSGRDSDDHKENSRKVQEIVVGKFPQAILKEEHHGMLTFYIPLDAIKWSELFGFMERNRTAMNVEDYSINQTTLEEIFLDFAKHQREDTRKPYKAGFCGCSC